MNTLTGVLRGATCSLCLILPAGLPAAAQQIAGAIFTTNASCTGTDLNIYDLRQSVYLDGGPGHPGAAGLPDGFYYIQVTAPDGTLLGTSLPGAPVQVVNGSFLQCYQLWAILTKASDQTQGYDLTPNPGGEYKVWASTVADFTNSLTKTDNFKVKENAPDPGGDQTPPTKLAIHKFYDANANGIYDAGEPVLSNWKVAYSPDGLTWTVRFTEVDDVIAPGGYQVTEFMPTQTSWVATGPTTRLLAVAEGTTAQVWFGNVCLGPGGGLTLGFWSNKNGQALFGADDLALMNSLNLRNANGTDFNPASYSAFRTWILGATATNMSCMLSAQLAAMELNVLNGKVNAGALIYAPGSNSANAMGFATVAGVMGEANAILGSYGLVLSADPVRAYEEALKNALDKANNNLNFVQAGPCAYTF